MAYYSNALPATLGADSIFSASHSRQRQILRSVDPSSGERALHVDLSRNAKSLYESALSKMTIGQLAKLRQSDEFKEVQRNLKRLQSVTDMTDPSLETHVQDMYAALYDYHELIDDVLSIRRAFDTGSRILDQWHLRGFIKNGAWLLRLGAKAIARKEVRATVTASLAHLLKPIAHVDAAPVLLAYYALGGIPKVEDTLNHLPVRIDELKRLRSVTSERRDTIKAQIDIAPSLYKDSVYAADFT